MQGIFCSSVRSSDNPDRCPLEWPTLAVLMACFGVWLLLTWMHHLIAWPLLVLLGGYVTGLHSSLQHEALHGHPTRRAGLNETLVYCTLGLFYPYRRFKSLHLRHHRDERLTDPFDDPESWYVADDQWQRLSWPMRLALRVNATLLGRLAIGPALGMAGFLRHDWQMMCRGDAAVRRAWLHHLAGCAPVVLWLVVVCEMNLLLYVACFAYPALSFISLRTYGEHRAAESVAHRSAIIETSPVFSLLFLNNNLHALHHANPRLAWYRLPQLLASDPSGWRRHNGHNGFNGYLALIRAHLFRPREPIVHPFLRRGEGS